MKSIAQSDRMMVGPAAPATRSEAAGVALLPVGLAPRSDGDGAAAPDRDERALVDRCRAGERAAQEELLERYHRPVYALVRGYLRDREEAQDVAQRALLEAFAHLPAFRGESSFRTWLYRIALNLASRAGRRAQAERRLRAAPPVAPEGEREAGAEQRLMGESRRQALQQAVALLPEKQRRAVELRVFADLSFREVAEALGCSEDAAKMNFHHGLRRLRALLRGGEHDEPGL